MSGKSSILVNSLDHHVRAENDYYDDPKDIDHDDGTEVTK